MEHRLGVSDNELPGRKAPPDQSQFALSSYDQQILASGPPQTGDGPLPISYASPSASEAGGSSQRGQYAAGSPAYPAQPSPYAQQPYSAAPAPAVYQPSGYPGYAVAGGSTPYASPPAAATAYMSPPVYGEYQAAPAAGGYPQAPAAYPPSAYSRAVPYRAAAAYSPQAAAGPGGAGYYDYSQAQGRLGGANSMIASAAAFTDGGGGGGGQYANLGWHPTLSRELGIPKVLVPVV